MRIESPGPGASRWMRFTFDYVKHYLRILKILSETDRIMQALTMDLTK